MLKLNLQTFAGASNGRYFYIDVNTGTDVSPVWTKAGGQRDASLEYSKDAIDTTSKTSANGYKEKDHGLKEWSIEFDALFVKNETAFAALVTAFDTDKDIQIRISDGTGTGSAVSWKSGKGIITKINNEFPYEKEATYSVSVEGNGPLT